MNKDAHKHFAWRIAGIVALLGSVTTGTLSAQEPISLQPKDGLVCVIVNRNSGRCLSYVEGEAALGSKIVQGPTPDEAGPNERWKLVASGSAYWLRNEKTGLVVQIWASNLQPGPQGNLAKQVNGAHQHWTFEPAGDGYLLRAGHSQLVLGVAARALEAGARVIQWNAVPNNKDQIWVLRAPDDRTSIFDAAKTKAPASGSFALWVLAGGLIASLLFAVILGFTLRRRAAKKEPPAEVIQKDERQKEPASFVVVCPACGKKLKVKPEFEGKKVKCVRCGQPVPVQSVPPDENRKT